LALNQSHGCFHFFPNTNPNTPISFHSNETMSMTLEEKLEALTNSDQSISSSNQELKDQNKYLRC